MATQALRERQMLMERLRAAQKRQRLSSEPRPSPTAPSGPQPPFTRTDAAKQRSVLRARWSAERLAEDVACDRRQTIVLRHARESSAREAERLQRQAAAALQRAELAKAKAEAAEAAEAAQTAEEETTQAARANRAVRVEVAAEDAAVDPAQEMAGEEAVEEAAAGSSSSFLRSD